MPKPEIEERLGAEITRLLGECDRLQRTLSTICIERPLTVSYQNVIKERDDLAARYKALCDTIRREREIREREVHNSIAHQVEYGLTNLGIAHCGACVSIFYTGITTATHSPTCRWVPGGTAAAKDP